MIFWTNFVDMPKINTSPPRLVLLRNHDRVSQPLGMEDFPDESGCKQSGHFLSDSFSFFRRKSSQGFLNRSCSRIYIQFVLSQLSWNSWHVRGLPCEDIPILTEKVDELEFLFGIHIRCYVCELIFVSGVYLDFLCFSR